MPHPCVVCGRSRMNPNNQLEEYMFFGFPVNDEPRCQAWLEFCCREDLYKLTKKQLLQRMVCSKHFDQSSFLNDYLDRLNCSAVPTIYDPKQSLYNISCVLCDRVRRNSSNEVDDVSFHHFPGEEFRCLKWLDFVGVESYYRLTRKEILFCYICSRHFDKSQFMYGFRSRLVDNAVPNIRDPNIDSNIKPVILKLQSSKPKLFTSLPEEKVKYEPLPTAVLESQACAACGRSRSNPNNKIEKYKFHSFPAYEIGRCLKWCKFLGREDLLKMSPNQIRKLILCSKHFEIGQNFQKLGPCDAVPTIKNIHEENNVPEESTEDNEGRSHDVDDDCNTKKEKRQRALVSSKKPKIDNKPAPLAKKRGKSRRPTLINIPRPDFNPDNRVLRKLPLPPANWKVQIPNSFQPITIANNINTTADIKKVILPYPGDISNLGTPIPVHSLSSIPPGLLIKIDFPENEKQIKSTKRKRKKSSDSPQTVTTQSNTVRRTRSTNNRHFIELHTNIENISAAQHSENFHHLETNDTVEESNIMIECLDDIEEKNMKFEEEQYDQEEVVEKKSIDFLESNRLSATARRSLIPIRCELRRFFHQLKPHMKRLPRKAKAQVKLAIVNMVIDRL